MEWISVKESLPPDRRVVLVFTVGLPERNGIRMSAYNKDQPLSMYWHGIIMGKGMGVTHWMPLPEPPTTQDRFALTPARALSTHSASSSLLSSR